MYCKWEELRQKGEERKGEREEDVFSLRFILVKISEMLSLTVPQQDSNP